MSTLIALTEDDHAALKELLTSLLDSLEADRALLPSLRGQGNVQTLHDLAHRVKGGARMVKAKVLIACCEALEEACEQQAYDTLGVSAEAVSQALGDLHDGLSAYCNKR
ncbi:HPt (histidine-containing phosphotransfer) domain-containing protein [Pseudomonas tolaasii]